MKLSQTIGLAAAVTGACSNYEGVPSKVEQINAATVCTQQGETGRQLRYQINVTVSGPKPQMNILASDKFEPTSDPIKDINWSSGRLLPSPESDNPLTNRTRLITIDGEMPIDRIARDMIVSIQGQHTYKNISHPSAIVVFSDVTPCATPASLAPSADQQQ